MEFLWDKQLNYDVTTTTEIWMKTYVNSAELGSYVSRILR